MKDFFIPLDGWDYWLIKAASATIVDSDQELLTETQ
jgi:hypothetical protein